jgi:predicted nucleic acid-binding protein
VIVSNTTPLSSLLKIGKTHLLQALYGTLTIPPEVATELDQAGPIHDGWREQLGFVRVAEPSMDDPVVKLLGAELDPGEAAAIALARRLNSDLLILDDMAGRRLSKFWCQYAYLPKSDPSAQEWRSVGPTQGVGE